MSARRSEAQQAAPPPEVLLREERRRQAERLVLELHSVQPALPGPMRAEVARPGVLAGRHRVSGMPPARPSAAAAPKVRALRATEEAEALVSQRLVQAERLAPPARRAAVVAAVLEVRQVLRVVAAQPQAAPEQPAVWDVVEVRPRAAPEVWDAAVGPRPAAELAGVARQLEAAVQRRAAGPASVAARLREAQVAGPDAEEARLRGAAAEAPDAAVARRQEAAEGPVAAVVRRRVGPGEQAVLPSVAAWAELPSTRLQGARLAPSARARSAHARECLRTAQP